MNSAPALENNRNAEPQKIKKVWQTPTIEIISSSQDIEAKNNASTKESLYTPGDAPIAPKASFHS